MKIVVNLLNFRSENIAGVGYYMKRIFELLDTQNTKGFSFCILQLPNIDVRHVFSINQGLDVEFREVRYVSNFFLRILYEQFVLPFKLSGCDVFYSPTPAVPILLPRFNKKIKIIPTIHDLIPFYVKKKYPFLSSLYVRWITKTSARVADTVIAVSENTRKDIIKIIGISEQKVKIVYNFIPCKTLDKSSISNNYFVTVCTIEPGKNLHNLLKAFKIYLDKYKRYDFKLYIIGKNGWNYKEIYRLCADSGLQNNVVFTGYLLEDDKNLLIRESMAMVYLSMYEGFGLPPLEAMYWNKPSIVSNTSSLPEVVGNAGILCNPLDTGEIAQAMLDIIKNKEEYCSYIPQQLQKYDPTIQISNFLQIIKS